MKKGRGPTPSRTRSTKPKGGTKELRAGLKVTPWKREAVPAKEEHGKKKGGAAQEKRGNTEKQ